MAENKNRRFTQADKMKCAKKFGISIETVNKYVSTYKIDINDFKAVEAHRVKHPTRNAPVSGDTQQLKDTKLKKEIENKTLTNEKLQIQIDREMGELIPITELESLLVKIGTVTKVNLEKLIGTLPPMCEGMNAKQIQRIVAEKVEEILTAISDLSEYTKVEDDE